MIKLVDLHASQYAKKRSTSCSQKGKSFSIEGTTKEVRDNLYCVEIDGKVFPGSIHGLKKCDFLFLYRVNNGVLFTCLVELKGKNIDEAIPQLKSTFENIEIPAQTKKYAFVVASKNDMPSAKTSRQKYEREFLSKYGAKFDMKNVSMIKTIAELS